MKFCLNLCLLTLGFSESAFGSACFTGATLQDYLSSGGCTIAAGGHTYTVDQFTFLAVGVLATPSTPNEIKVTTSVGPNGPMVNFDVSALAAGLVSAETYLFGFDIVADSPAIQFTGVNLSEKSALTGLSAGIAAEEDCSGGALPLPSKINVLSLGSGGLACLGGGVSVGASIGLGSLVPGSADANVNIPINRFSSSVDVLKELQLVAVAGSAQINNVGQAFTVTPEPASFFFAGCGLLALGMLRKRKEGE
jgi:hypothetical protein